MENIERIAAKLNIKDIEPMGPYKAKVKPIYGFDKSHIILITATNPSKYGEGKTTVAIGLNDALNKLKKRSLAVLREPSMGPVFGVKGGATGGGKASMVPESDINLHFTGDFHAITSANNLICAVIDNEIYHGNHLDIKRVTFRRTIDMNDRALRNIVINKETDFERIEHFDITAASEVMAVFCLACDEADLYRRLDKIIVGYNSKDMPIMVRDLGITDAVYGLLLAAFKPNLVQSLEGNPILVHGGPFANIAHGVSSVVSLETASHYADYVVTEAGFGADAGAFKFMDIIARKHNLAITIVLVTTIRALKQHGADDLEKGIANLKSHVENLRLMNDEIIVTLNRFADDTENDISFVANYCAHLGVTFSINTVYRDGSSGALDLARKVMAFKAAPVRQIYALTSPLEEKIRTFAQVIAHAKDVDIPRDLKEKIASLDKYAYPLCIAKTQYSIAHDPKLLGDPHDYIMPIRDVEVANGAEFIKVYMGNILTMPGLSENPSVKEIKIDNDNIILPR